MILIVTSTDAQSHGERRAVLLEKLLLPARHVVLEDPDAALPAGTLEAAQSTPALVTAGTGKALETLRAIASVDGRSLTTEDDAALLRQLGTLADRPGLAAYLAAVAGGAPALRGWAAEYPEDPLSSSAGLGLDHAQYSKVVEDMTARSPEVAPVSGAQADVTAWRQCVLHATVSAGLTSVLSVCLYLAFLPQTQTDRYGLLGIMAMIVVAAFGGSALARRLLDFGAPRISLRRDAQNLMLAVAFTFAILVVATILAVIVALIVDRTFSGIAVWLMIGALSVAGATALVSALVHGVAIALTRRKPSWRVPVALTTLVLAAAGAAYVTAFTWTPAQLELQTDRVLARKGFLRGSIPDDGARTRAVGDARTKLGLPGGPTADKQLLARLGALPDRTEWVLAADGSGDGPDLVEILDRIAAAVALGELQNHQVLVRPGTYRPAATQAAKDVGVILGLTQGTVTLRGTGAKDDTVIELEGNDLTGLSIDDDVIENLTLTQTAPSSVSFVNLGEGVIRNVRINARATTQAIEIYGGSRSRTIIEKSDIRNTEGVGIHIGGTASPPAEGQTASRPGATLRGNRFDTQSTAVHVTDEASPLVIDNEIIKVAAGSGVYATNKTTGDFINNRISSTGKYAAVAADESANILVVGNKLRDMKGSCVGAYGSSRLRLGGNDLRGCTTPNFYAVEASGLAQVTLGENLGAGRADVTVAKNAKLTISAVKYDAGASKPLDYTE